jgi:regulator of sigma E protease
MDLNWLWVVPILGILIIVHEMGHFFSAIWLGIGVEEFGLGFPPRVFAIRRKGIDYSLNLLPIGGFVKITGENGDSDDPKSFGKAPAWKRIIVLAAGSFMNLFLALVIFTGLSIAGTQQLDTSQAPMTGIACVVCSSLPANEPAQLGGMLPGDKIVSIAGQPVSDDTGIRNLSSQNAGKPTKFTVLRDGKQVDLTITPNSSSPYLGVILTPWLQPPTISAVHSGGAAEKAGLQNGDVLVEVNGQPVDNTAIATYLVSDSQNKHQLASLVVMRNGQRIGPLQVDPSAVGLYLPYNTVYYGPFEALGRALNNRATVQVSPLSLASASLRVKSPKTRV